MATLIRHATFAESAETIRVCRDPKDDKWLELAVGGNAAFVISGDDDLLAIGKYQDIPIVAPAMFVQLLAEKK